jgi:hypothetical protein
MRQALNGGDVCAFELNGQDGTRFDGVAVHNHGAATALTGITPDMGPGQTAMIS